jgi:leucyl-tRNA synthetase
VAQPRGRGHWCRPAGRRKRRHRHARILHRTIDGRSGDFEHLRFNTAIAKLIELNNHLTKVVGSGGALTRDVAEPLVLMACAAHAAHRRRALAGARARRVARLRGVPRRRYALLIAETVEYPVQVNGKVRSRVTVAADASPTEVEAVALVDVKVLGSLDGATPRR